jgi:hypothetical protein
MTATTDKNPRGGRSKKERDVAAGRCDVEALRGRGDGAAEVT